MTEQVIGLANGGIVFANEDTSIVVGLTKFGDSLHILCWDMAFVDYLVAYIAIATVHGNIAVYQSTAL